MKYSDKNLPSISILSPMYNPKKQVLRRVLEAIRNQDYPKNKVEHLMLSWQSPKKTKLLAKNYGCRIIVKDNVADTEHRKSIGIQMAKNDLVLFLNLDNIMTNDKFLRLLAEPFMFEKNLLGSFPLHFGYRRKRMGLVDRYCGLFGMADPVVLYLKKNDRQPWYVDDFPYKKPLKKKDSYSMFKFDKNSLPTVGDNGHLVNRKFIAKSNLQNEDYLHIDSFIDVLQQGHNRFAVVKGVEVEHLVAKNLFSLAKRRSSYMNIRSPLRQKRAYLMFNPRLPKDVINLFLFVIFTITLIQPLWLSIKGYLKIRDIAWFLHPIACFVFLVYYSKTYSRLVVERLIRI